jgi:hypothetical protein
LRGWEALQFAVTFLHLWALFFPGRLNIPAARTTLRALFMAMNFTVLRRFLTAILLMVSSNLALATNCVYNGSFELREAGWRYQGAIDVRLNRVSADGTNHLVIVSAVWQDIPTVPGETYYIRFAYQQGVPSVYFDGAPVSMNPLPDSPSLFWHYVDTFASATGALTRLEFRGGVPIDDVQIMATHEPVQIISQPESRSALANGAVSFAVRADGGPPISYAWRFNGVPIEGATNFSLLLNNAKEADAGVYSVLVSNVAGALLSDTATLTVEAPPSAPVIVTQPMGDSMPAGYACHLTVSAIGQDPLTYQWFHDGATLAEGTNRVLSFLSMSPTNAGTYIVRVANHMGNVLSLPTTVTVMAPVDGGGLVDFKNFSPTGKPIYDYDGVTKLAGSNYMAQLYAATSPVLLRPVGAPQPFMTGGLAGYFERAMIMLPDIPPGELVYVQTRVWESAAGVSFEDARAQGGKWGTSPVFSIVAVSLIGIPPSVPSVSFNLRAGSPLFTTGTLTVNRRHHGEPIEWKLTGASNSRYLIEKRTPPQTWTPLLVVTNTAGTVLFSDTNETAGQINFYRSRMLD